MRKLFLAAGLFIASGAFALDINFGGGLVLGYTASSIATNDSMLQYGTFTVQGSNVDFYYNESLELWYKTSAIDIGFFGFADCTYAEFTVGYLGQLGTMTDQRSKRHYYQEENGIKTNEEWESYSRDDIFLNNSLIFADLLGKYPVKLNSRLSVFPALGFGFDFAVGGNEQSDYERALFWNFNLKGGGGLDYRLSGRLFLRGELLMAFRLASDRDGLFDVGYQMNKDTERKLFKILDEGHRFGPQLKIAVGYTVP
jgi:hypothetical protein